MANLRVPSFSGIFSNHKVFFEKLSRESAENLFQKKINLEERARMDLNFGGSATGISDNYLKPLKSINSYGESSPSESAPVGDFLENTIQNYGDRLDIGHNPALDSVADAIYDELCAGRDVCLMTHSRGDILTNRALQDVENRLMLEDSLTPLEAKVVLSRIKVETFSFSAAA